MYLEILKREIQKDEVSLKLDRLVRKNGGIDAIDEAIAEKICRTCRIKAEAAKDIRPEEAAYQEYRKNKESISFWKSLRADLGEAHGFGEMCGYNADGDKEARDRYNAEILKLEKRQEEIYDLAQKGARLNGCTI